MLSVRGDTSEVSRTGRREIQSDTAGAGLLVAIALFAWLVTGTQATDSLCDSPVEREAAGGHTTLVGCDGNRTSHAELRGPVRRLFGHRVDLNCSDPLTLQTLSGIGPARAQAIVDERSSSRYQRVDDLTRVRGIGPKTLARLRDELVVENGQPSVESPGCRTNS